MRSKLTLLTTAAALAFGLTASAALAEDAPAATGDAPGATQDITIVENTGNAPGGTGVEESTESKGATNKQGVNETTMPPASGAGSMQGGGDKSSDQGGTGVKASADGEGATNKSTEDPGATGMNEGASSGNAPGGTGVEQSAEGQGAKSQTAPN